MSSDGHDPDEILRDSGGSSFINVNSLPSNTSDNLNFDEWLKGYEEEGALDATSSFPVEGSAPQGALDGNLETNSSLLVQMYPPQGALDGNLETNSSLLVQMYPPQGALDGNLETNSSLLARMYPPQGVLDGNLETNSSLPAQMYPPQGAVDGNSDPTTSFPMQTSVPQEAVDGNSDTTSSLPVQTSAPQEATDIIDKPAPSTLAPFSLGSTFTHFRNLWSARNPSPTPAQDIEPVRGSNPTGAYSPPSLAASTPRKRKRSDGEDDHLPLAPKTTRKRQVRNPSWHHFSQPGSPIMIVDGQPVYMEAQAPAPAPAPAPASVSGVKTSVGGNGSAKLGDEERCVDSNRLRRMIKKGPAETQGLREGEKWECRVPGGRYAIECLSGELCAMQWFGEVVVV